MSQGFTHALPIPLPVNMGGTGTTTSTGTGSVVLGTGPTINSPKINQINDQASNSPVMVFAASVSPVNFITASSGATGTPTGFLFTGSDSNVNATFTTKGLGSLIFANTTGGNMLQMSAPASAVNYMLMNSAAATGSPSLTAIGTDTNIILTVNGKGTGGAAIKGTGTNDNAGTGYVGEFLEASNLIGTPIVFTSGVIRNFQLLVLQPGDWDVWGHIHWTGTTITASQAGLSTTSATNPDGSLTNFIAPLATSTAVGFSVPMLRFVVPAATTTTVYLVGTVAGTGTLNGSGGIYARRVR